MGQWTTGPGGRVDERLKAPRVAHLLLLSLVSVVAPLQACTTPEETGPTELHGIDRYCDVPVDRGDGTVVDVRVTGSDTEDSLLGVRFLRDRKWTQAVEAFGEAVKRQPDDHQSFFGQAVAYEKRGDYNKAATVYRKAFILGRLDAYADGAKRSRTKQEQAASVAEVDIHAPRSIAASSVREELDRIVASTPLWDGKVSRLRLISYQEDRQLLRATVGAVEPRAIHELQVLVREGLLAFVRDRDVPTGSGSGDP